MRFGGFDSGPSSCHFKEFAHFIFYEFFFGLCFYLQLLVDFCILAHKFEQRLHQRAVVVVIERIQLRERSVHLLNDLAGVKGHFKQLADMLLQSQVILLQAINSSHKLVKLVEVGDLDLIKHFRLLEQIYYGAVWRRGRALEQIIGATHVTIWITVVIQ